MDDVLYASLPADHPLATRRAIALTDLCDEDWMLVGLRGTCADSNIVLRACQQAGFEPRVAYTSDDYFAIQGLVASGMGVALVPGLALASHARRRRGPPAARPPALPAHRRGLQPEPVGPLAVMLDCLRDAAEEYKRAAPMSAVAASLTRRGSVARTSIDRADRIGGAPPRLGDRDDALQSRCFRPSDRRGGWKEQAGVGASEAPLLPPWPRLGGRKAEAT